MNKLTTRDAIRGVLALPDLPTVDVPVPEWDAVLTVRGLTGTERDAFEESCYVGRGKDRRENFGNLRARLVALCVVDEAGARVFAPDDVEALGQKSAAALERLFTAAQRACGLSAQDVEELAGNSESARRGGSTSTSPSASA
jgi:hypothetical protein